MERGSPREGYGSIVASGANATTLHYVYNDQVCRDGDLILVDAGGEYNFYSGDITRVFPISGSFNPTQKRVYQRMLDVQKHLVAMVKPGISRDTLQKESISKITDILLEEKLLKGRKDDIIEKREYSKFYMHGVSHWLGMDVHDAGLIEINGEPRPLEPGFVLTVEPGLYVPQDAPGVPEELRGLGIRIEDDILVTETGHENMTIKAPKEIADIESVMIKR
jgi:Xaa-Pro aminopeptidase